jgi:phytoene/squalene synthetase
MTESFDDYCANEVRKQDPDRWLTALFAPDRHRPAILALYAFNAEIARARESVSQPMIGQIRLQWWREAWDGITLGQPRNHPVVQALHAHLGSVDPADAYALIEGRERDLDPAPMSDMAALLAYADVTSSPLMRLAAGILGVELSPDQRRAISNAGTAYALVGILRSTSYLAAQQRVLLPADRLQAAGIAPDSVHQKDHGRAVFSIIAEVAQEADKQLHALRHVQIPRALLPVLLPASLARLFLGKLARAGYNPDAPEAAASATRKHLAILSAYLRGTI